MSIRTLALLAVSALPTAHASAQGMMRLEPGVLTRTTLPEARTICVAMGLPPTAPCDEDVILERSQEQTDPALWFDHATATLGEREPCDRPVAAVSYTMVNKPGAGTLYLCRTPAEDDTFTAQDIDHLRTVVARLNADHPKTLAKHQWVLDFKHFWRESP